MSDLSLDGVFVLWALGEAAIIVLALFRIWRRVRKLDDGFKKLKSAMSNNNLPDGFAPSSWIGPPTSRSKRP